MENFVGLLITFRRAEADPSSDITYQVNYVEENQRKGKDPWSFRHVGIYHHHTKTSDLYIVLHPNQQAVLEDSLVDILKRRPSQLAASDPYRLHNLTLSSYFDNWRWYFRHLGDAFALEVCSPTLDDTIACLSI
jgi:hypothetical protein